MTYPLNAYEHALPNPPSVPQWSQLLPDTLSLRVNGACPQVYERSLKTGATDSSIRRRQRRTGMTNLPKASYLRFCYSPQTGKDLSQVMSNPVSIALMHKSSEFAGVICLRIL